MAIACRRATPRKALPPHKWAASLKTTASISSSMLSNLVSGAAFAYRPQRRASVNIGGMNFHIYYIFDVSQNASDSRSLYRKKAFDRAIGNV